MTSLIRLTIYLLVLTIYTCDKAFSQPTDVALQEDNFINLYSKIISFIQANNDSISFYSGKFEAAFTKFIQNNPATLNYPFKKLIANNYCNIQTSGEGSFRVYSWDTWTGGTMRIFKTIYQWKSNGKVYTKIPRYDERDGGSFCSKIFTVNIHDKPYYLTVTNSIFSTKDIMQSISAYCIEDNKLADTVKLFRTKTKKLNTIDVEFDFFNIVDRPERPLELIMYDEKQKIIYIPVVDDNGKVTKKNILYQLEGEYFKFIGIKTGTRK